jgi:hypothetical protein
LETELRGAFCEEVHLLLAVARLVVREALVDVLVSPEQQAIDQAGEPIGHGRDRLRRAEPAAEATILRPEVALAAQERGGGEAERRGLPIDDVASASAQDLVAAGAIVGTEPEPRGEMGLGLPAGHVEADFADQGLGDADIDAVDAGEIDATDAGELVPEIKLRRLRSRLAGRPAGRRRGVDGVARLVGHGVQVRLEGPVAFDDALPIGVIEVDLLLGSVWATTRRTAAEPLASSMSFLAIPVA